MNVRSAVSSRLALQRFFARTDFVPSKTSISRRSRPGSAAPFKDSRPDTLVFMLSTLSTNLVRVDRSAQRRMAGWRDSLAPPCTRASALTPTVASRGAFYRRRPLGQLLLVQEVGQTAACSTP